MFCSVTSFSLSIVKILDDNIGIKVKDTNSEAVKDKVTVKAKSLNTVPIIPSINTIGINTAIVVKVDAVIAMPTSDAPFIAASCLEYPSVLKRYIFSNTTIALSTNIPTANANPPRVIMFNVILLKYSNVNDAIRDIGIDVPITNVVLIFFKKIYKITTASIDPIIAFFATLFIESLIIVELSNTTSMSTFG